MNAAIVEIQIGSVKGESTVLGVGWVVEGPLSQPSDYGEACNACGQDVGSGRFPLPRIEGLAGLADLDTEITAQIPGHSAQGATDFRVAELVAQRVVSRAEQIVADVGGEVAVAAEHRYSAAQLGGKLPAGLDHGLAKVAHDSAGRTEATHNRPHVVEDRLGVLGRNLPGSQDPSAPSSQDGQQRPPTVLARGIGVHGPAAVFFQRPPYLRRTRLVQPQEVIQE